MGTGILRIEGGYVGIDPRELLHAWRACLDGPPGVGGFRAWLAAKEMVARRQGAANRRTPVYDVAEMATLLGVSSRTASASVRSLARAGLLEWSERAVCFPASPHEMVKDLDDTIGRGNGVVALPRRMLRFLARGARPALIATALSALLRCLSRRRSGFLSRGRLAASWVARTFGIDLRRVKQARAELVALGWIASESSAKWATNRWGGAWAVNLAWRRPLDDCHPGPAQTGASLPPPCLDPDPLQERSDPDPAEPGPTGASLGQEDGKIPAPNLHDIRPEDLADTGRTLALHRQAITRGVVTSSERDKVRFVAAAEHARAVGKVNPPGLLARIVSRGWWHLLTQADEDRAARRLRENQRAMVASRIKPKFEAEARDRQSHGLTGPGKPIEPTTPPRNNGTLSANLHKASPVHAAAEAAKLLNVSPRAVETAMLRSPYAQERPAKEVSSLGSLLARLAIGAGPIAT